MHKKNLLGFEAMAMAWKDKTLEVKSSVWVEFHKAEEVQSDWITKSILCLNDWEVRIRPSKLDECMAEITSNPSLSWVRGHRSYLKDILAKYIPGEE